MNTKGKYAKSIFNRWYFLLVFEMVNPERFKEFQKSKELIRHMDFLEGMVRGIASGDLHMEAGGGRIVLTQQKKEDQKKGTSK